jgi:hypothetical protein
MKFKTLRKKETKEFVSIDTWLDMSMLFTRQIPEILPMTATMENIIEYHREYSPIPDFSFDDLELIELDIIETSAVGADIRNKLSPAKNLVALLEEYFSVQVGYISTERTKLVEIIKNEMEQTNKSVEYLTELL